MSAGGERPNCLVLAAGRRGAEDSVAKLQGKSHKCLVELDGMPMIERVVQTLLDAERFNRILISIESAEVLREVPKAAEWLDRGVIEVVPSRDTLADSVLSVTDTVDDPLPLVITTGDNALHTPALVAEFVDGFMGGGADVALGFTHEDDVVAEVPDSGLAFHRMRDGGWSSCNLYGIRSRAGLEAAEVFRSGGQFGKRHWRILKAFGIVPFLVYKSRLATGAQLTARIGRNLGIRMELVMLPYAAGPIDVDNPASFHLTERLLRERRGVTC